MMKYFALLVGLIVLFSGCTSDDGNGDSTTLATEPSVTTQISVTTITDVSTITTVPSTPGQTYIMADVSIHNRESDCWLLVNGKVYDVTSFVSGHPGGAALLQGCGTDASELYATRPMGSGTDHSQGAKDLLEMFYIGDLA